MGAQQVISLNGFSGSGFAGESLSRNRAWGKRRQLLVLNASHGSHHRDVRLERERRRTKAKSQKRLIWWFATCWCVGTLVFLSVLNGQASADNQTVSVRVQTGQTLWGISVSIRPGQDPRSTVQQIIKLNHLNGSQAIYPGEILQVPRN